MLVKTGSGEGLRHSRDVSVSMATVSDPDGDPPDGVEFVHEDDGESIDDPEAYLAEQGIDVEIPLAMLYEGLNVALQSHQ